MMGPVSLVVPNDRMRSNGHKLNHRKFHLNMRKNFSVRRTECRNKVAQRGCEISFSRDILNLPGCDPVQ